MDGHQNKGGVVWDGEDSEWGSGWKKIGHDWLLDNIWSSLVLWRGRMVLLLCGKMSYHLEMHAEIFGDEII